MKAIISHKSKDYRIDLNEPIDISLPLSSNGPRAWYVDPMKISPVINAHFTGSVALGGSVNFNQITFNPHGHGTHTESVGHITKDLVSVNHALQRYFFHAVLITVSTELVDQDERIKKRGDLMITAAEIKRHLGGQRPEALIVRCLPNDDSKRHANYSNTNFPYFEPEALAFLAEIGVEHLLTDLPSVDRESDGGALLSHHSFWKYPQATRLHCTITEFVYVKGDVLDGEYLLNLQTVPFENDATPSRPVLYAINRV